MDLAKGLELTGGWVTLNRYVEITGDTKAAVHMRVRMGIWQRGVQYTCPDRGTAWVNMFEHAKWLKRDSTAVFIEEQAEAVAEAAKVPTFTAYIPVLDGSEDPVLYANLSGMDMPIDGPRGQTVGPLTAVPKNSRQFIHMDECQLWCMENDTDHKFTATPLELPYD